jgi:hypothetical protein
MSLRSTRRGCSHLGFVFFMHVHLELLPDLFPQGLLIALLHVPVKEHHQRDAA